MSGWSESKSITKASFSVLKARPYLLLFPVLGGVLALVAVAIPLAIGLTTLGWTRVSEDLASEESLSTTEIIVGIISIAVAVYLGTLVSQLFMGGLVAAADDELQGRKSSLGAGMGRAMAKFRPIAGWAGIEAVVGWLLSALRSNNSGGAAQAVSTIGAGILGAMWQIITFFVLPMIVLRDRGPITSIKESAKMIKSTWGQQIGGRVRIGGIVILLAVIPGVIATVIGVVLSANDSAVAGIPLVVIGVIVMILAGLVVSTLKAVFAVALLHWTEDKAAIGPFTNEQLQSAVKVKS
jgi:hypothetical protein